jgi:putative redox protein
MSTVTVKWIESRLMVGADSAGHPLVIGYQQNKVPQWAGMKASDLLLLSAGSCSTYDVVMILEKQKEPLEDLEVTVTGENNPDPPYNFTKIHLHYAIKGAVAPAKVERAIKLSEEKYCSVINTLKAGVEITNSFEVVE